VPGPVRQPIDSGSPDEPLPVQDVTLWRAALRRSARSLPVIWYKFNVGAYLAETLRLSDAEDLAYRRLIDLCYLSEQPLPLDKEAVARKIRMDLDVTESVLAEFFDRTEEGYRHARCEADIARYRRQVAINLENGRKGRHARSAD
jgi:uncharacterized protein YdaU (DUF1376 family)